MNKTLLMAGVATTLVAFNANAVELNPYVSAKLTYSDITYDGTNKYLSNNKPASSKDDLSDKVWGTSIAAGITTQLPYGALRTELEYNWNDTAEDGIGIGNKNIPGKVKLKSQSVFLNAYYDIDTCTRFTPYVGGGIGYAKVKGKASSMGESLSEDDTNFAWQLGAGVAYAINENVSVDLGYRYTDMGNIKYKLAPTSNYKLDIDSHEVLLGARYTF